MVHTHTSKVRPRSGWHPRLASFVLRMGPSVVVAAGRCQTAFLLQEDEVGHFLSNSIQEAPSSRRTSPKGAPKYTSNDKSEPDFGNNGRGGWIDMGWCGWVGGYVLAGGHSMRFCDYVWGTRVRVWARSWGCFERWWIRTPWKHCREGQKFDRPSR